MGQTGSDWFLVQTEIFSTETLKVVGHKCASINAYHGLFKKRDVNENYIILVSARSTKFSNTVHAGVLDRSLWFCSHRYIKYL